MFGMPEAAIDTPICRYNNQMSLSYLWEPVNSEKKLMEFVLQRGC
jgi:hypothetical protein